MQERQNGTYTFPNHRAQLPMLVRASLEGRIGSRDELAAELAADELASGELAGDKATAQGNKAAVQLR